MTRTTLVQTTAPALFMAFELSLKTWLVAASDRNGTDIRMRKIDAGDWSDLERFIASARKHFRLPADCEVLTCYEAGRDGFWIHRALEARRISNFILDPSSIEVPRRARQAKTDRLDAKKLLALLLRLARGDKAAKIVVVPSIEEEDERQPHRERQALQKLISMMTNMIKSLLTTHSLPHVCGRRVTAEQVGELRMWNGQQLPPKLQVRLKREIETRDMLLNQLRELDAKVRDELKDRALAAEHDAQGDDPAVRLQTLVGIGQTGATVLAREMMWRDFKNRREVGAYTGLVGVPRLSGGGGHGGNISKAGNARLRRIAIELTWLWERYQPDSPLTKWFRARFKDGGSRTRRVGIVAFARKLMIELWRFVKHGVVPEGARFKAA